MTANVENQKANNTIGRKTIGNVKNRTPHTLSQATLIRPAKAIIRARDTIKRKSIGKNTGTYQIMRKINGKDAGKSV